jgi:hypothetical protein
VLKVISSYQFNPSLLESRSESSLSPFILQQKIELQHPLGHVCSFSFDVSKDEIILFAEIIEPKNSVKELAPIHPEWYFHDHFVILLDPKHDHATQYLIAINKDGNQFSSVQTILPGEEPSDRFVRNLNSDHFRFNREITITPNGWKVKVNIPIPSLGLLSMPTVMGVKIKLSFESLIIIDAVTWPETKGPNGDTPLEFGDFVISPEILVRKVDFGSPFWKTGNISTNVLLIGSVFDCNKSLVVDVSVTNVLGQTEINQYPLVVGANGNFDCKVNVDCHFANKWAPDFGKIARVLIEIKNKEKVLWGSSYPLGFDAGIILREPFGKFKKNQYKRPLKSDPHFVDNFRCWLFSKFPNWVYQTTRNKAPSDFYLKDLNGKFNLNLMDENSLEQIADYLKSEFDDWQDALCAAALLLHHPFLTRHSSSWSALSGQSSLDTILRLGATFCGETSRMSAFIAELIGDRFQVKLKGFVFGLRGHTSGLVETPIGDVLIDPMLGIYYQTLDNERLATIQEMRIEKKIQERMWLLAFSNGHEFFIEIQNQMKKFYKKGDYVYPGFDLKGEINV